MDRVTADCELRTGSDLRFAVAGPDDEGPIRRLLRENPMAGAIRISFEREPDFFRGAAVGGAEEQTILAYRGERLVCMGRCITRLCWVDGTVKRVGYLSELRLDRSARGRFDVMRRGYAFFRKLHEGANAVDLYFTSIASDNLRARRLLEHGARGLPSYRCLAELVTVVAPVRRPPRRRTGAVHFERARPSDVEAIVDLLNRFGQDRQFAPTWTAEKWGSLAKHQLDAENCQLAFWEGRLVACVGLWDQRAFRQTVVQGYSAWLRLLRPVLNLSARTFGGAPMPRVGSTVAHAYVSPLAMIPGHEAVVPELLRAVMADARLRRIQFVTMGFDARDPLLRFVRSEAGGRVYRTRLYRVAWDNEQGFSTSEVARLYAPDVSLL